MNTHTLQNAGW